MAGPNLAALLLDLMDTVLHDPYREALEAATGVTLEAAHRFKDPHAWPAFERAEIDEVTFEARFFGPVEAAGAPALDLEAFRRVRLAGYRFLPDMEALLDDVALAVPTWIASNYPIWIEELVERFELDRRCKGVVASYQLGSRKPEPAFFEGLLARVGLPAHACLFVDDKAHNCAAAEAAGMRAHLFGGADDLRARLRAEGVAL